MRYCLIGCGRVSPEHIGAAKRNGLEVVGLCDIDPAQVCANLGFAEEWLRGIPVFTDYKEMMAQLQPELVAIATPSGLHAPMALDCLRSGAHVIIEKPIAMHMEEARLIAQAAKETGRIVSNNLQNRFNPAVQALRQAVEAGRFGRIFSASMQLRWFRGEDYYRQAGWRGTRAMDGGAMMNQGIHGIDLLNWMLGGNPESVTAMTARLTHDIEMEDIAMAVVRYPAGALAQIECATLRYSGAQEEILELNGEHGCVRLGGIAGHVVELWRFDDATSGEEEAMCRQYAEEPETVYGSGHAMLYADTLEAIAQGCPPLVGVHEGSQALSIVLGAYESASNGKTIQI